jgi:hypothetical protein
MIWTNDKGGPSANGQDWPFISEESTTPCGTNTNTQHIFVYDLFNDRIVSSNYIPAAPSGSSCQATRWISMSASGAYVLTMQYRWPTAYPIHYGSSCATNNCVISWNTADFSPSMSWVEGHGDLAVAQNGHDAWVSSAATYLTWYDLPATTQYVTTYKLPYDSSGNQENAHVSGNAYSTPGWVLYSTYYIPSTRIPASGSLWINQETFMMELSLTNPTNPRIFRVGHIMEDQPTSFQNYESYWDQSWSTINKAGTHIYIGNNWLNAGQHLDVYRIAIPSDWFSQLGRTSPSAPSAPVLQIR